VSECLFVCLFVCVCGGGGSEQAYCSVLCRTAAGNEADPTFCVISGFRRRVNETFDPRGWYATYMGS